MKNTLPQRLKEIRIQNNLTQHEVAAVLSVERSTYTYYETGKAMPSFIKMATLAKFYDAPMEYFADGGPSKNISSKKKKRSAK